MLNPLTPDASAPARDRILLTAQQLFYRQGIRATGVDKVIAEAGVTKVTFYRHFPAKNALVVAFSLQRHDRWIAAFRAALAQQDSLIDALPATLLSWFREEDFRGCAFINTATEPGESLAEASTLIRQHKQAMAAAIAEKLPAGEQALLMPCVLLVEGAIVQVQIGEAAEAVTQALRAALMQRLQRRA